MKVDVSSCSHGRLRIKSFIGIKILLEPGFGSKEPPLGTTDQAGLRLKSFIGIRILLEPGFGAKEPPSGNPDQAGLRTKSLNRKKTC